MVRNHFPRLLGEETPICRRTYELCEFLTGVLDVESVEGRFAHRVGLHQSCHGLRELRLGTASERMVAGKDPARQLLRSLKDIELVELERPDECCGFGGTFSVDEEAVSCLMGRDRIADHRRAGAEIITSMDMSCLMHLQGLIRQQGDGPRVMHIAEILAAGEAAGT
jgi:L-lactate dehydrogenase complex protein LldE